jgi:hypothetical protein
MADTPPLTPQTGEALTASKRPLASKTFWVQLITLLAAFFPAVQEFMAANPVRFVAGLVAVNVLVRFATSGRIELFPPEEIDEESDGPGWSPMLLIGMTTACALVGGLLSSCQIPGDYDLTGRAFIGGSSAKAGLKFEGGNVIPFGKVAVRDPDTGKVTGYADIEARKRVSATK